MSNRAKEIMVTRKTITYRLVMRNHALKNYISTSSGKMDVAATGVGMDIEMAKVAVGEC